jgi:hypothetical protein
MASESKTRRSLGEGGRLLKAPLIAFLAGLIVFGLVSWDRLASHSHDNHYVYLAEAMLDGRLHIDGKPPHGNDWAEHEDRWYVSFPPLPAVLMIPGVAIWGLDFNDRLFTLVFAAVGPALMLLLLQLLAARGRLDRRPWETWLLAATYGVGTVYFFCAVQGSVWYTAHMVGGVMLLLFLIASLGGRHPLLAGLFLGLAFACRPPLLLAFPFFVYELLRATAPEPGVGLGAWFAGSLRTLGASRAVRAVVLFGAPIAAVIGTLMWLNFARFDDPFEFGHRLLKVIQAPRIEKWGLFHYHYLARNLAATFASLPWLSVQEPHVKISLHGLALWFTSPVLLWALWPKLRTRFYTLLAMTAVIVALPSLLYQNTGWIQFGQRFSLDYTPFLILLLASGSRRLGKLFVAGVVFAVAVNLFGAITFDRHQSFYGWGKHKHSIFQPD